MPENTKRLAVKYEDLSQIFHRHDPDFTKQYCNIYLKRLKQMNALLKDRIQKKWSNKYPIIQLHKLTEQDHSQCIVIGTLFKDQKLKPSILKQLSEESHLVPQPIRTHFTDKSDKLYIEDELQRYELVGAMNGDMLVTGISVALLGTDDGKGKFTVEDYIFADYRPQIKRPIVSSDVYVVFLSSLDFLHSETLAPNLQLLLYWLSGFVGDLGNVATSKVCRVILTGKAVRSAAEEVRPSISMLSRNTDCSGTIEAVYLLDKFLTHLGKVIDVDVMPGENDPTNSILPQKPMHCCMFPESSPYKSIKHVSNPYYCLIEGVKILGSSGQPARDILRYSELKNPLDALESCLKWSHLMPTAPDTLGCYPFYESDPFIITECPHVLFAGNQEEFATREVTGPEGQSVRLISIPEFNKTTQICVLNLKNLECNTISFDA